MRKRSVVIGGHATSISLEEEFWRELVAIAQERNLSLNAVVAEVDRARNERPNLSSALRLYVLETLKRKITPV